MHDIDDCIEYCHAGAFFQPIVYTLPEELQSVEWIPHRNPWSRRQPMRNKNQQDKYMNSVIIALTDTCSKLNLKNPSCYELCSVH